MKTRTHGPPCLPRGVKYHVFTHLLGLPRHGPQLTRDSWKRDHGFHARKRDHARNGAMQFSRGLRPLASRGGRQSNDMTPPP